VVVIEDVTTTGSSAMQAAEAVQAQGGNVVLVLSIVDRLEGAGDTFAAQRLPFRSLFTAAEFLRA
jgi:orotate phosphoribosyltransferase